MKNVSINSNKILPEIVSNHLKSKSFDYTSDFGKTIK